MHSRRTCFIDAEQHVETCSSAQSVETCVTATPIAKLQGMIDVSAVKRRVLAYVCLECREKLQCDQFLNNFFLPYYQPEINSEKIFFSELNLSRRNTGTSRRNRSISQFLRDHLRRIICSTYLKCGLSRRRTTLAFAPQVSPKIAG
jgi:hypothetical protein